MKRAALWAFVTSLLLAKFGPASAATGTETIVLDVGDYGVVQLPSGIEGASWLALCGAPGGSELRWSTVRMRAYFSDIAGDKSGQKSGRKVSASGCKAPRILVSDPALRAGKVRDAQVKGGDISMGDLRARLVVSPAKDESKTPARLLLEGAKGRLVLIEDPESDTVTYKLRWAGDLDGDGGLDLVIEEEADGVRVYLFLSRDKPVGGSWPPAAITFHGGC